MSRQCALCQTVLHVASGDYVNRGTCEHHLCMMCAVPLFAAGKALCPICVTVQGANGHVLVGNLVTGNDREQNVRAAADMMRYEREQKVRPLQERPQRSTKSASGAWLKQWVGFC